MILPEIEFEATCWNCYDGHCEIQAPHNFKVKLMFSENPGDGPNNLGIQLICKNCGNVQSYG